MTNHGPFTAQWTRLSNNDGFHELQLRVDKIEAQARIAELEAALTWYAEHVPDCRKAGLAGDVARGKLDRDGGSKARAALGGEV